MVCAAVPFPARRMGYGLRAHSQMGLKNRVQVSRNYWLQTFVVIISGERCTSRALSRDLSSAHAYLRFPHYGGE
jgi:hypothetical protein